MFYHNQGSLATDDDYKVPLVPLTLSLNGSHLMDALS